MAELKQMYKTIMDDDFPLEMTISFGDQVLRYRKRSWRVADGTTGELIEKGLRYGENPDQQAALYELVNGNLSLAGCEYIGAGQGLVSAISEADMLQAGKHPGKINLTDIDAGLNIPKHLMAEPAAVVIKHNNPSGVAQDHSIGTAFERAYMADRIAAFGGCAVVNRELDRQTADLISQQYLEVVAAPEFAPGVVEILKKRKNLRIIRIPRIDQLVRFASRRHIELKSLIDGGIVVQQSQINAIRDAQDLTPAETTYRGATYRIDRMPTAQEYRDLLFGWAVEQGVTSNSVLFVKDGCTVGIGTGEQDRVGVAEIAVMKAYTKYADRLCFNRFSIPLAQLRLEVEAATRSADDVAQIEAETQEARAGLPGSCMISDAFFPFRDGVDVGIRQGVTAIAQPGGSLRDFESITACNEATPQVAMVFTRQRAFKH